MQELKTLPQNLDFKILTMKYPYQKRLYYDLTSNAHVLDPNLRLLLRDRVYPMQQISSVVSDDTGVASIIFRPMHGEKIDEVLRPEHFVCMEKGVPARNANLWQALNNKTGHWKIGIRNAITYGRITNLTIGLEPRGTIQVSFEIIPLDDRDQPVRYFSTATKY